MTRTRFPGLITIVAVGRLRTAHWKAAEAEYLGRLQRYIKVKIVEVRDVVGHGLPDSVARDCEGEAILRAAANESRRIALDANGTLMNSVELSRHLQKLIEVYGNIAFLIGGPTGLVPQVLQQCHERLSLSRLTFPHELARVILLEQLFRSLTILAGEPYHK